MGPFTSGIQLIREERERQIKDEGFDRFHDEKNKKKELVRAAIAYAGHNILPGVEVSLVNIINGRVAMTGLWPWARYDKRKTHSEVRRLAIAGALIAAEIDRLQTEARRKQCKT